MGERSYESRMIGSGTEFDPFRPEIADDPKVADWSGEERAGGFDVRVKGLSDEDEQALLIKYPTTTKKTRR